MARAARTSDARYAAATPSRAPARESARGVFFITKRTIQRKIDYVLLDVLRNDGRDKERRRQVEAGSTKVRK